MISNDFSLLEVYAALLAVGLVLMFGALVFIAKNLISVNKKMDEIIKLQSENNSRETSNPTGYPAYTSGNYLRNNQ